jgi:hypothetical protein
VRSPRVRVLRLVDDARRRPGALLAAVADPRA